MAKTVYALVGSDSFLQLEKLAFVAAQLPGDTARFDIDGERAELADVLDELRSPGLFAARKLVVVRNADTLVARFRQGLESYLAAPADNSVLALRLNSLPSNTRVYKLIQKIGSVESCDPPHNVAQWIVQRARNVHRASLSPEAARLLEELIGQDMGRLDNELAKLALMAGSKAIDADMVRQGVAFQREQEMWAMTDELAAGHIGPALRRWRFLVELDGSTAFRAVTWLAIWLQKARRALEMSEQGMSPASIGQELRIWPADKQRPFISTAQRLGPQGLARAVDLLAEIDYQTKTGIGGAVENVERFLLGVGQLLGGAAAPAL